MKILAIETSCDETAIAIVEAEGNEKAAEFRVLGNVLLSQVEIHKEYGGVFPALAKREHAKNLVPILEAALEEAELLHEDKQVIQEEVRANISEMLAREPGLAEQFFEFVSECEPPAIDAIAVTAGPGLEPALWVGINFARALALVWGKPLVAVNHMEGHILSALATAPQESRNKPSISTRLNLVISDVEMPVLALLISGGHTELVLMKEWLKYELIGQTRDDAVGEAYDKVARMLALPYPGGPQISALAEIARKSADDTQINAEKNPRNSASVLRASALRLPRPMIDSGTCDFSFAGLKTAVLYLLKKQHILMNDRPDADKDILNKQIAYEFENAVADVLWKKTAMALEQTSAQTLVIGGGVSANEHIRRTFSEKISVEFPTVNFQLPTRELTTDNAIMIALAGFYRSTNAHGKPTTSAHGKPTEEIRASGNLSLAQKP